MQRKLDSQKPVFRKPIGKTKAAAPMGVSIDAWGGDSFDTVIKRATSEMTDDERANMHFTTQINNQQDSDMMDARGYKPLMKEGQQVRVGGDLVWMIPEKEYKKRIRAIGLESVRIKDAAKAVANPDQKVVDKEGQAHGLYGPAETEDT